MFEAGIFQPIPAEPRDDGTYMSSDEGLGDPGRTVYAEGFPRGVPFFMVLVGAVGMVRDLSALSKNYSHFRAWFHSCTFKTASSKL